MAGVGFELRKLFREQGMLNQTKAYFVSSVTTIGPMILCMFMIVAMQWIMEFFGISRQERELFLASAVYAFIFSVLITGGLSMVLTRFIADMMFLKKYEHLLSSYYGALAICLPIAAISSSLFLLTVDSNASYKLTAFLFFIELTIIWIQSVYLSALKDYFRIVRSFFIGVLISIGGTWVILEYTSFHEITAVLASINVGFLFILLSFGNYFHQVFPKQESRIYFQFLSYFPKYPSLFFIGTFFYSGVYAHSFVYWNGPWNYTIADGFTISPFYDLPVFYAFITVIPSLVTFVVSLETAFYEKFRDYFAHILSGGTLRDIAGAKQLMQKTLTSEVSFLMEVQLLFTIISFAIGTKVLPSIGFSMQQLDTFNILVISYYFYIMAFILMLVMLYFDDRLGVLFISGSFVLMNIMTSWWTMNSELHGFGMFIASFLTLSATLVRLMYYVRNIDYYTFSKQPIVHRKKEPFWRKWSKKAKVTSTVSILLLILLSGCSLPSSPSDSSIIDQQDINTGVGIDKLVEDKRLYERDQDDSVIALYVTVLPNEETALDWYTLNRVASREDEFQMDIIVQEGALDGSGPRGDSFGAGASSANAKIKLRGNSTRYSSQKSYKIDLEPNAGLWRDQKDINLIKQSPDFSRVRNKLSFDLFETIPDITSLRTQFIRLFVKDMSGGQNQFVDYGLFTHVEQPNKQFLRSHWLDPYGHLYKAIFFEFYRYEDQLKLQSDPDYDEAAFESILEIKGNKDHSKLLKMLDDVNDMTIPTEEVIDRHFDRDNLLTWVAANLLMDNMDTNSQNFFLYSPLNSNKWFFLPWDYDGAWARSRENWELDNFRNGISTYWNMVLFNRFFREQANVDALKEKMDELYNYINKDTVSALLEKYRNVVYPHLSREPDIQFLPKTLDQYDNEYAKMMEVPLRGMNIFLQDIERPKPFFLGHKVTDNNTIQFTWGMAYDLQGDDVTYDWYLARDPAFTTIIGEQKGLMGISHEIPILPAGTYYWKVIARDSQGNEALAFDQYRDDNNRYYGVMEMRVE